MTIRQRTVGLTARPPRLSRCRCCWPLEASRGAAPQKPGAWSCRVGLPSRQDNTSHRSAPAKELPVGVALVVLLCSLTGSRS